MPKGAPKHIANETHKRQKEKTKASKTKKPHGALP